MKTGVITGMPFEDYKVAHGINQSSLKKLARSPAHLKYALEHPEPSTPDQVMGTILHTAVFEPEKLETSCHVKPSTYTNSKGETKKWNGNATECRDWIASRSKDFPIIPQADFSSVLMMRDSVFNHPAASLALTTPGGKAEQSLFVEDPDTGLQLKARLDFASGNCIVDLKKCQDASPDGFTRTVAAYSYALQCAFYLDVCKLLGLPFEHMIFICVESEPPFCCAAYELDAESIEIGRSQYSRLMGKYLECIVADRWDGYSKNVERLSLPAWSKKQEFTAQQLEDRPQMPALEVE